MSATVADAIASVHVLCGTDTDAIAARQRAIRSAVLEGPMAPCNHDLLVPFEVFGPRRVMQVLRQVPMAAPRRLVELVFADVDEGYGRTVLAALGGYMRKPNPSTVLVLVAPRFDPAFLRASRRAGVRVERFRRARAAA